MTEAAAELA